MFSNSELNTFKIPRPRLEALEKWFKAIEPKLAAMSPETVWTKVSKELLEPTDPFEFHLACYARCFKAWNESEMGPPPAWSPEQKHIERSNILYLIKKAVKEYESARAMTSFQDLHKWSVENRIEFWELMLEQLGITYKKKPRAVLEDPESAKSVKTPSWLPGASLNIVDSCFENDPDTVAIVTQAEGGALRTITYGELETLTKRVASGLEKLGMKPGDAVAIDMVMTAESVAIYLGIIYAGCVVVSIADSFAPHEIETRLKIARTKAIFTQDTITRGGPSGVKTLPHYEKIQKANAPLAVVLPEFDLEKRGTVTLRAGDVWWSDFLGSKKVAASFAASPMDTINVMFSSGTTGDPKAIPWNHTSPLKSAMDGFVHHDIHPEQVVAWPTNLGWMMGPWLIFATLLNHATMALFNGVPSGRAFGEFIQNAGVQVLGVIPSIVKTWRASDCMRGLDWSKVKLFSSTGECSNREDYLFLMSLAGYKPVIEYCGGTEIGGGYITGTVVQHASPATFTTPSLGLDFVIYDENARRSNSGELYLVPPSIGLSVTLLNRDHEEAYFSDTPKGPSGEILRRHGDEVEALPGGYFRAHGRVDDTMNLGGIKVSSIEIERCVNLLPGMSESAAIVITPKGGGPSQLVMYVVLMINEEGQKLFASKEVFKQKVQDQIKKELNPLFKLHDVVIVPSLPRTASNKVMRRSLRAEYLKKLG